ncbi:MAG: hypothetical protein JNK99_17500 [Candidatus Accumulibacter sp.]|uniref:hypothetical protein n=1 Tax=Accumulibacter sp. TaxID=2053492 RepID=UPI001A3F05B5|nr:hypothetical protein [Accumulibacter sp.]MBL8396512.1 hypothetical protein [Accumulibacter sp.]
MGAAIHAQQPALARYPKRHHTISSSGLAESRHFPQHLPDASEKLFAMKMSSVFVKTPKGLDEISTRANHLPSRVRAMLIMIDGHRTGNELVTLSSSTSEGKRQIASLLSGGFIQVQSVAGSATAAAAIDPQPSSAEEDISLAKSYAARSLRELLGAESATLVAEIEQVRTIAELQQYVGRLRAALRAAPDQTKAKQFLQQIELVLD